MKDKRPINLDIGTIKLPLAALTSITHRISGVIVFIGIAFLLWLFDSSLDSAEGFANIHAAAQHPLARFVLWGVLAALAYHMVAGCKHLLMDVGIGESHSGGPKAAKVVVLVSIILIALLGVWLW